jgi:hypothetical protein
MSIHQVVLESSARLRQLLYDAYASDGPFFNAIKRPADAKTAISLNSPDAPPLPETCLSLWLYQVTENEFVKNRPAERIGSGPKRTTLQPAPLCLDLSYLVTPLRHQQTDNPTEVQQLILGKTAQVLHDNPVVPLSGDGIAEELHVVLCRRTVEELTRVWEALRSPYHLSVCYQVQVVRIDSLRRDDAAVVAERTTSSETMPPGPPA